VNVEVARSAPSFAQSTHRQHVVSVQQAKTRAPSAVSSCGAAAKTERASTSGQSNATATERERRPATVRSHTRRLDCAGGILIERGPASVIGTRALPHESACRAQRCGDVGSAAADAPSVDASFANFCQGVTTSGRGSTYSKLIKARPPFPSTWGVA